MKNSSNSDSSEDDTDAQHIRQFLEATDNTLFSNDMFLQPMKPPDKEQHDASSSPERESRESSNVNCKSERYLAAEEFTSGADINVPVAVQQHICKKLSQLIAENVEFCEMMTSELPLQKQARSKVKLLRDADCYVKPYEEFEFLSKGPAKKPLIKRRTVVDIEEVKEKITKENRLLAVVLEPETILSGLEVKSWAAKPERKDKVYHYKLSSNGQLHAKEIENEFTQLRRKNKWNERKINNKIKHPLLN